MLNTNPVIVSKDVLEGLKVIRESGLADMFDFEGVKQVAVQLQCNCTHAWITANKGKYAQGMFCGFICDPDNPTSLN